MPKEQVRPQPFLSDSGYERLLASCDASFVGRWDRAIMATLNATGCRRSELVALNIEDVDFEEGRVLIRKATSGHGRYGYLDDDAAKALALSEPVKGFETRAGLVALDLRLARGIVDPGGGGPLPVTRWLIDRS